MESKFSHRLWSLIPEGSHTIVHVLLSGISTMYHFFKNAHKNGLRVSKNLIRDGAFIRLTDFDFYIFKKIRDL